MSCIFTPPLPAVVHLYSGRLFVYYILYVHVCVCLSLCLSCNKSKSVNSSVTNFGKHYAILRRSARYWRQRADERVGGLSPRCDQESTKSTTRVENPRGPPGDALLLYLWRWYAVGVFWGEQVHGMWSSVCPVLSQVSFECFLYVNSRAPLIVCDCALYSCSVS